MDRVSKVENIRRISEAETSREIIALQAKVEALRLQETRLQVNLPFMEGCL